MKYLVPILLILLSVTACSTIKKPVDANAPTETPTQTSPKPEATSVNIKPTDKSNNRTVECKAEKDVRIITHMRSTSGKNLEDSRKCQILYKKFNTDEIVAYAHHQTDFCIGIFDKIIKNLQDGNFICADRDKE